MTANMCISVFWDQKKKKKKKKKKKQIRPTHLFPDMLQFAYCNMFGNKWVGRSDFFLSQANIIFSFILSQANIIFFYQPTVTTIKL